MNKPRIFPLGESAVTVDFGNEISAELNGGVLSLAKYFEENPFAGLIETVPAYSSLTVFFDVFQIRRNNANVETAFDWVKTKIEIALLKTSENLPVESRLVEIPVCFEPEFAPDLESLATRNNLSAEEIVRIFLSQTHRVYMLGFLPGFAYMGEVDERIAMERKTNPRLKIPAGSIGIAGKQTGIYSLESPGGWQIVGRTPLRMFDSQKEPPALLQAGDQVQFYPIDKPAFAHRQQNQFAIRNSQSAIE